MHVFARMSSSRNGTENKKKVVGQDTYISPFVDCIGDVTDALTGDAKDSLVRSDPNTITTSSDSIQNGDNIR